MWEQYNSGGIDFPTFDTLEFSPCTAVFSMALLSCISSPQISGWLCFMPQAEYWSTHTFFPLPFIRQDPFSRTLFLMHIHRGFHTQHQQRNLTGGFFWGILPFMTYDQLNKIELKLKTGSWKLILPLTVNNNFGKGLWCQSKYQVDVSALDLITLLLSCKQWACAWWKHLANVYGMPASNAQNGKMIRFPLLLCSGTTPAAAGMLTLYSNTETVCLCLSLTACFSFLKQSVYS